MNNGKTTRYVGLPVVYLCAGVVFSPYGVRVVDGHKGPPSNHPVRLISDCFPREITLFDIIYIFHTGGPHVPSLTFISLISLNSVYHICALLSSSLSFHQNIDQCNSLNLLCMLSAKFLCFAKGFGNSWLGYSTVTHAELRQPKIVLLKGGKPPHYMNGIRKAPSTLYC